jgi:alcohol-forming fatty acyl-CoA reductase
MLKSFPLKVFHRIKDKPELFKKLVPVYGDITSKRLGLDDEQFQRLVASSQIVYHMAASLKLEATLKPNVEMNLIGTQHVIDVCKQMPSLISFIHLSTAFCNCDQDVLKEEVYEWAQMPNDLIRCAGWMTEDAMVRIEFNFLQLSAQLKFFRISWARN